MKLLDVLLPAVAAAVLTFLATPLAARLGRLVGAIDEPGPRKVHTIPVPRTGGFGMIPVILVVLAWCRWGLSVRISALEEVAFVAMTAGLTPVFIVSALDDARPQRASVKFVAQLVGAGIAVLLGIRLGPAVHLFGGDLTLGILAGPISVLWIVAVTNAFNLTDGLDGLSAGLALIAAAGLAVVALASGSLASLIVAVVIAGAVAGFLPYNTYPARVFLGDSGAASLGFLLACIALPGGTTLPSTVAVVAPLLITGLPLAETALSMCRRLLRRGTDCGTKGVFVGDAEHIHHRLLQRGMGHQAAVLLLYAVGVVFTGLGVLSIFVTSATTAILLATLLAAATIAVRWLGYDELAVLRNGSVLRLYETPVLRLGFFRAWVDLGIVAFSVYLAFALKYDDWELRLHREDLLRVGTIVAPICLLIFSVCGLYRRSWRYASIHDLVGASIAVLGTGFTAWALCWLVEPRINPTVLIVMTLVLLLLTNGARASFRIVEQWSRATGDLRPVLIYGGGARGTSAAREIHSNASLSLRVIGYLDDDPTMRGKTVAGFPVVGALEDLGRILDQSRPEGLIVATRNVPEDRLEAVNRVCASYGVWSANYRVEFEGMPAFRMTSMVPVAQPVVEADGREQTELSAALQPCPKCQQTSLQRSRSRGPIERMRRLWGHRRPLRCVTCGWRGWQVPIERMEGLPWELPAPDLAGMEHSGGVAATTRELHSSNK